jgi:hypothetical protein
MRYRKKPVIIEAIQWTGTNTEDIRVFFGEAPNGPINTDKFVIYLSGVGESNTLTIKTLEGEMKAAIGDYVIRGVKGEFYPCKPDIFEQTYEKILEE